jgi:hypothetical protein
MNQGTLQAREKIQKGLAFFEQYDLVTNEGVSYDALLEEENIMSGFYKNVLEEVAPYVNKSKEDVDGEKGDKDEALERLAKRHKSAYDKIMGSIEGKVFCKELDATLCTIDEKKHLKTPLREDYLAKELRQASDNVHGSYILFMKGISNLTEEQLIDFRDKVPVNESKVNEWNNKYKEITGKDSPYFSKIGDYITILKKKVDEILGDEE